MAKITATGLLSFSGRIDRKSYVVYSFILFLLTISALIALMASADGFGSDFSGFSWGGLLQSSIGAPLGVIFVMATLIAISLAVRRLRDIFGIEEGAPPKLIALTVASLLPWIGLAVQIYLLVGKTAEGPSSEETPVL